MAGCFHDNPTLATFIGTLASRLKAYHHCRTDSDLVQLRSVALSLTRDHHRAIGHRAGMMVLRQDRLYPRCKAGPDQSVIKIYAAPCHIFQL
jgi:hypothetical protein